MRSLRTLGLFAASLVVSIGTFWAFTRGGKDFAVFYAAWRLVLQGHGAEVYQATPDRFLYAPGFAWLLAPLAYLPKSIALAIWCFAKAAIIGGIIRAFSVLGGNDSRGTDPNGRLALAGLSAWAVLLIARPILIDFEYGQVNLLILGACFWALLRHCDPRPRASIWDGVAWGALGVAAIAKLFPLPLVLVPFFSGARAPRARARWERAGVVLGILLILLLPASTLGFAGLMGLMSNWRLALVARGLPLESHNQSFAAFLHHYFSGEPTEIIAQGRRKLDLGYRLLSARTIAALTLTWAFCFMGVILALIFRGSWRGPWRGLQPNSGRFPDPEAWERSLSWIAAVVGLLVLPSHLVWKPYFCLGLPVAILAMRRFETRWPWILAIFAITNLSGFDFIGQELAARFEAGAVLLWTHLALYAVAF